MSFHDSLACLSSIRVGVRQGSLWLEFCHIVIEEDDKQQQQQGSTLSHSHLSGLLQLTQDHLDPLLCVAVESAWNSACAMASASASSHSCSSIRTDAAME